MFKELEAALAALKFKQDAVNQHEAALDKARLELGAAKAAVQKLHEDYMKIVAGVVSVAKSVSH